MKTITLKRPIVLAGPVAGAEQRWDKLVLRDMEAGDICDAGREMPDGSSQSEMQLRVAAKCADLAFVILRKLKPVDMVQIETWWSAQWNAGEAKAEADAEGENPSTAEGTQQQS